MAPPTIHYEREGAIATITLDDPDHRNALSAPIRQGLRAALEAAHEDDEVRVAIITGAGDRAFCAGAHLKEMAESGLGVPSADYMPIVGRTVAFSKVLIAAVNGAALGGGFLVAQMADLVVAADHATFGMPEARVGRGAPWSVPLSAMIPKRVWLQLCLTGQPIDARRAYEVGLVNAVVPADRVLPEARALAEAVAANAPLTVAASKEMVRLAGELGCTAAWDAADALFEPVYRSRDAVEGPAAFGEHRPPRWQGH
ncbi:MAG TPA: enoyl-CoA hydratase-related protein [Acidimicrobiales bacterium]|nr:enoyl-CoA hydratase-related protein [Acidimicrobiales bacterium]